MRIHVLHTGMVKISQSLAFRDTKVNPSLVQLSLVSSYGRKNRKWFPVSAYLIEHPEGLILYDAGWSRDISPNIKYSIISQIKHQTLPLFLANQGIVPVNEAINEQLDNLGFSESDLDYVVLSHLDVDHVSGVKHLKDAKKIMVSNEELNFAKKNKLRYVSKMWKGVNLETFDYIQKELNNKEDILNYGPVGKIFNLFEDESIQLINIPGHTPGLTAMRINNIENDKFVLLFSDGGYSHRSWEKMIMPGITDDEDMARRSLKWIHDLSIKENCIESLANHDIDVKPHIIEL